MPPQTDHAESSADPYQKHFKENFADFQGPAEYRDIPVSFCQRYFLTEYETFSAFRWYYD
jgi:hypothetical protein